MAQIDDERRRLAQSLGMTLEELAAEEREVDEWIEKERKIRQELRRRLAENN